MRLLTALALSGILAGCSTVSVSYDYDPEEDFTRFRSFAWLDVGAVPTGNPRADSPLLRARIRDGIGQALVAKGLRPVSSSPDVWVVFHFSVEERVRVSSTNQYYARHGWTRSVPVTSVEHYEQGTLIIDIVDARDQELVWRGVGEGRLRNRPGTPAEQEERARLVAAEILEPYPPSALQDDRVR